MSELADVDDAAIGLLTIPEVAALLRLSKATVWRRIYSGQLESVKDGRSRRVPRQAVRRYIANLPHQGQGAA